MNKALFVLSVIITFGLFLFAPAYAENTLPAELKANEESGYVGNGVFTVTSLTNTITALAGAAGAPQLLTDDPSQQQSYFQNSILGYANKGIALTYERPPAQLSTYIADVGARAGIVKPAYAQGIGIGFNGLLPLLPIWRAFRNIAYAFLIIIMIIVGFMMMFRMKIDPRTVISVQNAIPRIIVTLILITFSYAIVGFMIELSYLLIYISLYALGAADSRIISMFSGGALTNMVGTSFSVGLGGIDDLLLFLGIGFNQSSVANNISLIAGLVVGAAGFIINPALGLIGGVAAAGAVSFLPKAIVGLVVVITLIFLVMRIFFMLLGAWIQVMISLIFAPIYLMFGAIPGVNTFGMWFKGLISNLIVFPVTAIILFVSAYLTVQTGSLESIWRPPGLGGTTGQGAAGLIGLGMLLVIPNLVKGLQAMFKAQSPVQIGMGTFGGGVGQLFGVGMQALQMQMYLGQNTPIMGLFNKLRGKP